jgi:hypothetical protein
MPRPDGGCGLSAHFMIDADGTIYQTLDLLESAWHAEQANSASIGIEICNRGDATRNELDRLPSDYRSRPVKDVVINGNPHRAFDFRPEQYTSILALVAPPRPPLPRRQARLPRARRPATPRDAARSRILRRHRGPPPRGQGAPQVGPPAPSTGRASSACSTAFTSPSPCGATPRCLTTPTSCAARPSPSTRTPRSARAASTPSAPRASGTRAPTCAAWPGTRCMRPCAGPPARRALRRGERLLARLPPHAP